jgi:hypothetical protein
VSTKVYSIEYDTGTKSWELLVATTYSKLSQVNSSHYYFGVHEQGIEISERGDDFPSRKLNLLRNIETKCTLFLSDVQYIGYTKHKNHKYSDATGLKEAPRQECRALPKSSRTRNRQVYRTALVNQFRHTDFQVFPMRISSDSQFHPYFTASTSSPPSLPEQ